MDITASTPILMSRARRLRGLVDRLYARGHNDLAFPLAREWHRIAAELRTRGIEIYVNQ